LYEEINQQRAWAMINSLISAVENFPKCREKKMLAFYLEELKYRFWHYKLGSLCPCTDIDFVEYRPPINKGWVEWDNCKPVGLVEIKSEQSARYRRRTDRQENILKTIATKLTLPLIFTTFSHDFTKFQVEPKVPEGTTEILSETEWMNLLQKLEAGVSGREHTQ